ncbi:uncharacterized protein ARMOST_16337 [Armillaria ostoyae]|uniref:Uncharacterized protein n=1 Tax=Armillaria ostoyae TaxID=47428 RepID=A0A284RVW8_ARMOS|nr:uncharacterized protein ARMOST_16337 [Armillaria ostoyae]
MPQKVNFYYLARSSDFKETPKHESRIPQGFECGNDPTVILLRQFAPHLSGYSRRMDDVDKRPTLTLCCARSGCLISSEPGIVDVHSLQSDTPDLGDSSHSTVQFPAVRRPLPRYAPCGK